MRRRGNRCKQLLGCNSGPKRMLPKNILSQSVCQTCFFGPNGLSYANQWGASMESFGLCQSALSFCSNHARALASSGSHLAVLGAGKTFASLLAYSSRACLHDSGLQVRCNRASLLVFIQSQLGGVTYP